MMTLLRISDDSASNGFLVKPEDSIREAAYALRIKQITLGTGCTWMILLMIVWSLVLVGHLN